MIEYPAGDWETDKNIPGKFVRDYVELMENIFEADNPIRSAKNERLNIVNFYSAETSNLDGDFVDLSFDAGESAFFMAKNCNTSVHFLNNWENPLTLTSDDNEFYRDNEYRVDLDVPKTTLAQFENVVFHDNDATTELDSLPNISLLHIDLKTHKLTKLALEKAWSKVVDGGVVIVDLHDSYATGAEKAATDFFAIVGKDITVLPTGKAVILK